LYGSGFDHPDAAYLIPYPGAGQHALLERLLVVAEKEDVGAVIPCLDSEIENYISIQEELKRVGIDCILPTMASFNARHKAFLPAFCERIGVSVPTTRIATNAAEIDFYAQELGYPVYVKGRLYDAHLVNSPSELVGAYSGIVRVWGWPIIVQEVVVGEEYDITGVGDGKGKILHSCSIRKLLRTSSGKGYGGIVVENPELDEIAAKIISGLKWNGPFEMEFIKSAGRPFALFEINPRFPAWVDFPSQIGANLPALLLERLLKMRVSKLEKCQAGQMFIRHTMDLVGDFSDFVEMATKGERLLNHSS